LKTLTRELDSPASVVAAARLTATRLARGQVVAFPTDTVYGLAADARSPKAVQQLFELKGREENKPFALLLPAASYAWQLGLTPPNERALALARRLLPGAFTLLVQRSPDAALAAPLCTPKLGLRVPDFAFTQALTEVFEGPIALTSANLSGHPEPTTSSELGALWQGKVPLLVLSSTPASGQASTVLDLTETPPRIVRWGPHSPEELTALIGDFS